MISTETTPILGVQDSGPAIAGYQGSTYGWIMCTCMLLNYLLGTGILSLPLAFVEAGFIPTTLMLCLSCAVTIYSVNGLYEASIKVWAVLAVNPYYIDEYSEADVRSLSRVCQNSRGLVDLRDDKQWFPKIEISLLCDLVAGRWLSKFCQIALSTFGLSLLWSYAAVFAASADSLFFQFVMTPLGWHERPCDVYEDPSFACNAGYYVALFLFAVFVLYLSCQDLGDQATVQSFLTGYRFFAFALMFLTSVVALMFDINPFLDPTQAASSTSGAFVDGSVPEGHAVPPVEPHGSTVSPLLLRNNWAAVPIIFSFVAVAFNCPYNVPDVVTPCWQFQRLIYLVVTGVQPGAHSQAVTVQGNGESAYWGGPIDRKLNTDTEHVVDMTQEEQRLALKRSQDEVSTLMKPVSKALQTALVVTLIVYVLIGATAGAVFHSHTLPLVTLNWESYSGQDGGWGQGDQNSSLAYFVRLAIMLFPTLNMLSIFPMCAVSIGDNVRTIFEGNEFVESVVGWFFGHDDLARKQVKFFRLVAAFPPLVLAALVGKLDRIIAVAGLLAFITQLVIPALVVFFAGRMCSDVWGGSRPTPFPVLESASCTSWRALFVAAIGVAALSYATYNTV